MTLKRIVSSSTNLTNLEGRPDDIVSGLQTPKLVFYSNSDARSESSESSESTLCQSSSWSSIASEEPQVTYLELCDVILEYIAEMKQSYSLDTLSFGKLWDSIGSLPNVTRYVQWLVVNKLCKVPLSYVNYFVKCVIEFIKDPDFRQATITEFVGFVESMKKSYQHHRNSVFENLRAFYKQVVAKFRDYLINFWLMTLKISKPCQFGAPSDILFLCMNCHEEHY